MGYRDRRLSVGRGVRDATRPTCKEALDYGEASGATVVGLLDVGLRRPHWPVLTIRAERRMSVAVVLCSRRGLPGPSAASAFPPRFAVQL